MAIPDRTYLRGCTYDELVTHAQEQLQRTELEIVLTERLAERDAVDAAYLMAREDLSRANERIDQLERDNCLLADEVRTLHLQLKI